uniref:Truncated NS2 protein n=1 Tax=Tenuivirus oryzaclavatae TaxID=3052763 RepID=B0EVT8_9VIRU|nr:truncated NS2 protein [Tenuivirus oryzaclavatae]
MALLLFNDH